jgi:hypothetical protein
VVCVHHRTSRGEWVSEWVSECVCGSVGVWEGEGGS